MLFTETLRVVKKREEMEGALTTRLRTDCADLGCVGTAGVRGETSSFTDIPPLRLSDV